MLISSSRGFMIPIKKASDALHDLLGLREETLPEECVCDGFIVMSWSPQPRSAVEDHVACMCLYYIIKGFLGSGLEKPTQ